MRKFQLRRVQPQSPQGIFRSPVFFVADNRKSLFLELYADLIFSACVYLYTHKRILRAFLHDGVMRNRFLPRWIVRRIYDVVFIFLQKGNDSPLLFRWFPFCHRVVFPRFYILVPVHSQHGMHFYIFGEYQNAPKSPCLFCAE